MQAHISKFHWSKNTRTLSAEASDLGLGAGQLAPEIAVEGIRETVTFHDPQATRDRENDIVCWTYTSAATPVRLVVFND